MTLDSTVVASLTRSFSPTKYLRATPWAYRKTPLGMGYGKTRSASPTNGFRLLYLGEALETCIAEAVIRDRFEGVAARQLTRKEMGGWGVCEVEATKPLRLLYLRGNGCFRLGISSDIAGGKSQDEARAFSETLYATTNLDGILYRSRLMKDQVCVAVYDRAVKPGLRNGKLVKMEKLANLVPALGGLHIQLV